MKEFFDTSVLIASFWRGHPDHSASLKLVASAHKNVQEVRQRCTIVTLDEEEYFDTITRASDRGFSNGRIYDALLLRCADKANDFARYRFNPSLADRIRTAPRNAARNAGGRAEAPPQIPAGSGTCGRTL